LLVKLGAEMAAAGVAVDVGLDTGTSMRPDMLLRKPAEGAGANEAEAMRMPLAAAPA
jgi:hypothetical protein